MIQLQIISRANENLQSLIRVAIADGQIRSFVSAKVVGGMKITHKKHPGVISLSNAKGVLLASISCTNPSTEWQLLETFVGRIAYHFSKKVSALNIQFPENMASGLRPI